jgi:hypothetical protein
VKDVLVGLVCRKCCGFNLHQSGNHLPIAASVNTGRFLDILPIYNSFA